MKKILTQLVTDYLADPSDLRLQLLVMNMNPALKLTKQLKEGLKLALTDYKGDPSKRRLDIILNILQASKTSEPVQRVKVKLPAKNKALTTLENKVEGLYRTLKDTSDNSLVPQIKDLERQIDALVRIEDKQAVVTVDPKEEERKMIRNVLGDWQHDPESIGSKIIKNQVMSCQIRTYYDPAQLIKRMYLLSGLDPMEWSAGLKSAGDNQPYLWVCRRGQMVSMDQGATHMDTGQELNLSI